MTDALLKAAAADTALFCTPGHKRGHAIPRSMGQLGSAQAFRADLPDLPGFNLFEPEGVIAAAQSFAAETFGAEQTWFLVNGSTVGIMASLLATCGPREKIILPRNVHTSVISGLILSGAHPIFIHPEYDPHWDVMHCITPAAVALALKHHPDAKAILMVSPTYHGICGDVGEIAHLAHRQDLPLIVDEAHGAHFGFHPHLPPSALGLGADIVVQSTHKTLSALTQASLLHRQGPLVNGQRVKSALQMLQSSSPSNILLASLEGACQQMWSEGQDRLAHILGLAQAVRDEISKLERLSILQPPKIPTAGFCHLDLTRLTLNVSALGLDGFTVDEILTTQFGVIAELPSLRHLTFILSLGNHEGDTERLVKALRHLNQQTPPPPSSIHPPNDWPRAAPTPPECVALSPREAYFAPQVTIPLNQGVGEISAATLCAYPPGIPIVLPGERITETAIAYLEQVEIAGGLITGYADPSRQQIQIVVNNT